MEGLSAFHQPLDGWRTETGGAAHPVGLADLQVSAGSAPQTHELFVMSTK